MPRSSNPVPQYFTAKNKILVGGLMFYFEVGTSDPKATFSDPEETIQNTHPVVLDSEGRLPNVFFTGAAKQVLEDANNVQIWERDNVGDQDTPNFNDADLQFFSTTQNMIDTFNKTVVLNDIVETLGFTTEGDGGGAQWRFTGLTGQTPNQSPEDLDGKLLNDANGNQWALVVDGPINALSLGAKNDGSDNSALFNTFNAGDLIEFSEGVYVSNNATILSDVVFTGGSLSVNTGQTVQISGSLSANHYDRIFTGLGTVFPLGERTWSICWFGFYADATNAALNALARDRYMRAYGNISERMSTLIPSGRYENGGANDYTDMIFLWKPQTNIVGGGSASTWFKWGIQLMADDTDLNGITIQNQNYGLLLDDESDTNYPVYVPRFGETTRLAQGITPPGRALRRDIVDVQTFGCIYGVVELDNSPAQHFSHVRVLQSTTDGWTIAKSVNTDDDVGNTHLTDCRVEGSGRHNMRILKVGSLHLTNSKLFHTNPNAVAASFYAFVISHSDPDSTGHEVIRQIWLDNTSLEGTNRRTMNITSIADGGSGTIILTLDANHYLSKGNFFSNIEGTASYDNVRTRVDEVISNTSIRVSSFDGPAFTFTGTETGEFLPKTIDLWLESQDGGTNKRIIRTLINGGDANNVVAINCRNLVFSGALAPKESGYLRTCDAVVMQPQPLGFNGGDWVPSNRYDEGFLPLNVDAATKVYRSGWGDDFSEDYFATMNNNTARTYDYATGEWLRVGVDVKPVIGNFANYAHGNTEISNFQTRGKDSNGLTVIYQNIKVSVQDDTAGSEDVICSFNYPIAGVFQDRWTMRRGFYYSQVTGGDPAIIGACNFTGYEVNGNAGATGTFTSVTVENGIIVSGT